MKIKIKITKEVLKRANMCGIDTSANINQNCAIALAIRDIFPLAAVETNTLYPFPTYLNDYGLVDDKCKPVIALPVRVCDFIEEFDNASPAERLLMPKFEFNIDIPDTIIDRINISDIHKSATLELA